MAGRERVWSTSMGTPGEPSLRRRRGVGNEVGEAGAESEAREVHPQESERLRSWLMVRTRGSGVSGVTGVHAEVEGLVGGTIVSNPLRCSVPFLRSHPRPDSLRTRQRGSG